MTENNTIYSYKDLIVWQKAITLVIEIYTLTNKFPKEEIYGLTSQMRRAAISIPSNIAEGRRRGSKKEFHQFLLIAYGSGAELETQIEIAKKLPFGNNLDYNKIDSLLIEIMKMLNKILSTLRS
ncbi:MAG: four helix bundle protein [Patescibacteria group bacterium]|nr:four helix bundle protein [Patescibacteria group bacterium]